MKCKDRILVQQLNQGSKEALHRIYARYRIELYTMATALLGDGHLAEDCLHDVFVTLAQKVGDIRIRSNLKAYLVTAVINRARDRLRRRTHQVESSLEIFANEVPDHDPHGSLVNAEQTGALLRAMGKLPQEQREVFVLHVQGNWSFRRIGALQKVSVRTAHSRYRYAIGKLRQLLAKEGVEP